MNVLPKLCPKRKRELIGSDNAFIFNLLFSATFLVAIDTLGISTGGLLPLTSEDLRKLEASILNKFCPLSQSLPKLFGHVTCAFHSQCHFCQKVVFNQSVASSHLKLQAVSEGNNIRLVHTTRSF